MPLDDLDPAASPWADLRARDLMSTPVVAIDADASLRDAVAAMKRHDVKHLIVPGAGQPVGLVTDRDIRLQLPSRAHATPQEQDALPTTTLVESVCIRRPLTVEPEASLNAVAQSMRRHAVGSVLVVEADAVVGIITSTNFVDLFARG